MPSSSGWRRQAWRKRNGPVLSLWVSWLPRHCACCSRSSPSNCSRSLDCYSPAASYYRGYAGKCGELHRPSSEVEVTEAGETRAPPKTFAKAAWQIVVADISMSLDKYWRWQGPRGGIRLLWYSG